MSSDPGTWNFETDVVVVGSGGSAFAAALAAADQGAAVTLLEKDSVLGGTTGVSGGVMWVPNNHHVAQDDSPEEARAYIRRIADGAELDADLIDVFVDTAPEMLEFLERVTPLETQIVTTLPDYYGVIGDRIPGCKEFSRSVEPLPFNAKEVLGEWADVVAARSTLLSLGASTTLREDMESDFGISSIDLNVVAERERAGIRVKGAALIGCMLRGALDLGVDVRVSSPVRSLVRASDGSVIGVVAEIDGTEVRIGARRGVILACGGFEWNKDMVLGYLGVDVQPLSPGGNTGDGHLMAMEAGAKLGNMGSYWGQGAMYDPAIVHDDGRPAAQMGLGLGRGSVIVNQQGERFMHGGFTYNDFPKPFGAFDQRFPGRPNKPPAWIVFGPSVKETRPILTMRPGEPAPDWLAQAPTLAELAAKINVPVEALERSVTQFNEYAAAGADPEWGAVTQNGVPTGYDDVLAPVDGPPFYALQLWPGTLGTNGGCRLNANGQVLGHRTPVIDGLYAAGNTSASILGGAYLGGGTPIASGTTFGYLAGRHAAAAAARDISTAGSH